MCRRERGGRHGVTGRHERADTIGRRKVVDGVVARGMDGEKAVGCMFARQETGIEGRKMGRERMEDGCRWIQIENGR